MPAAVDSRIVIVHHPSPRPLHEAQVSEILFHAHDAHGVMDPCPGVDVDHLAVQLFALRRRVARHAMVVGHLVGLGDHGRVRRASTDVAAHLPALLDAGGDERAGLLARHLRDGDESGDDGAALEGVLVLHAGEEHTQRGFHERGAESGVQWLVGRRELQAAEDAPDVVGPLNRLTGGDACRHHRCWRHGRMCTSGNDTSRIEHSPDTGD